MSNTITIKKDSLWKYSTLVLLLLVVAGAFIIFAGNSEPKPGELPKSPEKISMGVDDDAVLGNADAPITIIEFSDYQCPFCERFWSDTLPQIKSEYIDTGKARFIYRDFPLSGHPMAGPAAEAAECVREQGGDESYFEYHDKIFENQQILNRANLILWTKESGYDINSCLNLNKFALEINGDLREGSSAGITGTPGFFVLMEKDNADIEKLIAMQIESSQRPGTYVIRYVESEEGLVGLRIVGAHPFTTFQNAIEIGLN